ncbi:substrate-binding domain-containing protein, partial [Streptomyces asiaticus]
VVAYNDVVADMGQIALTAVAPPKGEVGQAALEMLTRQLERTRAGRWAGAARHLELLPDLVVRDSTAQLL